MVLLKSTTINGHTVHIDSSPQDGLWTVLLTSADKKTAADGTGETENQAYNEAVASLEARTSPS